VTRRRAVEDEAGNRYLLLKQSGDSSLVRDPETGERTHLPTESVDATEQSALETILSPVPEAVLDLLTAVHDERALAVVLELDAEGPLAVRTLLNSYDFCESDLHGLLAELQAAGLIAEASVAGERGYETTEAATEALGVVRDREVVGE
jgi:hypothetical protein